MGYGVIRVCDERGGLNGSVCVDGEYMAFRVDNLVAAVRAVLVLLLLREVYRSAPRALRFNWLEF